MSRLAFSAPGAVAVGPYSHAVEANGFVHLSGQTPIDPATGRLVEGDAAAQTAQCLKNLFAVLTSAGLGEEDVVSCAVYLTDMNDFAAMNAAYAGFFSEPHPARTTIGVAALPLGARVEIGLVAARPQDAVTADSTAPGRERLIEAPGPLGPLAGTLTTAGPGAPVVLIIPGSGPTDRDGNNPLGISGSLYRQIAGALAARGIAGVRIDKRGMFGSRAAVADANAVTIPDYVTDTRSWIAAIRRETGASCVWLLGHSEGGLVALATAQEAKDVCGLLLVATAGRTFGDLLSAQVATNPAYAAAGVLETAQALIAQMETGQKVEVADLHPLLRRLFHPAIQEFLISEMALDPASLLAEAPQPVLIMQGLKDFQVTRTDAERLKGARPDAELVWLDNANHALREVASDSREANVATYSASNLPLAPGVIDALAGFIERGGRPR